MSCPYSIQISGPLKPFIDGAWDALEEQGYAPLSNRRVLQAISRLSKWLQHKGLEATALGPALAAEFFRDERKVGHFSHRSIKTLRPLIEYFRTKGIELERDASEPQSPFDRVLKQYEVYLQQERGLVPRTVRQLLDDARRYLSRHTGSSGIRFDRITVDDLRTYVLQKSHRYQVATTKVIVSNLRSLMRFLHLRGEIPHDLSGAIPAIAGWRQSGLPKALSDAEVGALLGSCDRRTRVGRRDFAMMLCMVRLGLRAGEVAALTLDDLHWARGEVLIHGKGGHEDWLPIPTDVGTAVAGYLRRGRPKSSIRQVFLLSRAPYSGVSSGTVKAVVRGACKRAGQPSVGAHRLRHTAATQMLRQGANLEEIGQVLRHRHLGTTAIYAKVDRTTLRELVQPWPGGAS